MARGLAPGPNTKGCFADTAGAVMDTRIGPLLKAARLYVSMVFELRIVLMNDACSNLDKQGASSMLA